MHAAIDRHDGCSDKFLGDAVLAFWNGLSDEPEHAFKALATAQEIIAAVSNAEGSSEHRLAARAVVCSGRVYVGDLGAKQRSNFTIIGPAVNETFRLEKVPDLYGLPLLVAASTAELIMSSQPIAASAEVLASNVLVRVDDVELKGFAKPDSVYALVPRDDPGLARFEAGRKALDQQMLCEGLAHLKERRPRDAATGGESRGRSLPDPLTNLQNSVSRPLLAPARREMWQRRGFVGVRQRCDWMATSGGKADRSTDQMRLCN